MYGILILLCNSFFFFNLFGYSLFSVALGLCFALAGLSLAAVLGLLTEVASLVAEHRLYRSGSVVVAHGLYLFHGL